MVLRMQNLPLRHPRQVPLNRVFQLPCADVEEGDLRVGAYRLDTVVPEMIKNDTIIELSAVTAIAGLYHTRWRKYMC